MHYIGIDLHKKSITICLVDQQGQIQARRQLSCQQPERIVAWFQQWTPFQAVMEATASYEWLWQLLEPLADRLVLAHPGKMRIIAESTRKSDRYDARVLAEFLALGMIPEAYRPSPRQRAHRRLVGRTRRWGSIFEALSKRRGRRWAIVAVSRRLLCVMAAMMKNGPGYRLAAA